MEIIFTVFLIANLIILFILMGKLNRIEYFLFSKTRGTEQKKFPETPPKKETYSIGQPPQQTAPPATQKAPPPPTEKPVFSAPKPQQKQSVFHPFWQWFCTGSMKENEHVSKEYAVATTWLIRAGVLILLCGIGFFLKYSIENNLISPPVRVSITFLTGLLLFLGGIWGLNKRFHLISIGILSAGIVILYMGSFAGYKLYSLLSAEIAFVLMVLTTIAAMLVSVRENLLPAALTGCAGGYLTPVMLSDNAGNLPFFLGYTAMISAGVLIVSRERRWRSLEIMAFLFSFLLTFIGSADYARKINWLCILFLFLNFLVFSAIPVIRKKDTPAGKTEWLLPIFSAAITLLLGLDMIEKTIRNFDLYYKEYERPCMAGFAILIAAVTLAEGLWLNRKHENGAKMLPSFLCASIFALALSVPIALQSSESIAAAWSILAFVLVLAAERSRLKTLLVLSGLIFFAVLFCIADSGNYQVMERFFRGGVFAFALLGSAFLLRKHSGQNHQISLFPAVKICYAAAGGLAFLWYTSYEIYHHLNVSETLHHFRHGGLSLWWAIAAVSLIAWGIRKKCKAVRVAGLALFVICLVKIYYIDISVLNTLGKVIAFLLLGILFLGGAAAYIFFRKYFKEEEQ